MIRLAYAVKDFEQMVDDWCNTLNVNHDHHLLWLPPSAGSGYLYANNINEAMSFLIVNVRFDDDVVLERQALTDMNLLLYFVQVNVAHYYEIASDTERIR